MDVDKPTRTIQPVLRGVAESTQGIVVSKFATEVRVVEIEVEYDDGGEGSTVTMMMYMYEGEDHKIR